MAAPDALLAQGANTGLVAASTPDASGTQVVLSTRRMKDFLSVDATARTAHVSAGVLLSELDEAASRHCRKVILTSMSPTSATSLTAACTSILCARRRARSPTPKSPTSAAGSTRWLSATSAALPSAHR
ncbi:FAD-binding protein [Variovorax sp. PBS-H4]|uniref:FAD-binding protein n=1 Tax=Variovorax sp. PBS-H4 TaxID=434008 RepID=UPI001E2E7C45|nr:FAD-binding protein [Variovorax sp. PBS-H4]